MGRVVSLDERRPMPHNAGIARCMKCQHEWTAVAPAGVVFLECPKCGCDGALCGPVVRGKDDWHCQCGWALFRIDREGPYCPNCGTAQEIT